MAPATPRHGDAVGASPAAPEVIHRLSAAQGPLMFFIGGLLRWQLGRDRRDLTCGFASSPMAATVMVTTEEYERLGVLFG